MSATTTAQGSCDAVGRVRLCPCHVAFLCWSDLCDGCSAVLLLSLCNMSFMESLTSDSVPGQTVPAACVQWS